jgi:hypothetical protein
LAEHNFHIPPRLIQKGDPDVCARYIGYAKRMLRIVEQDMSFQNLNIGKHSRKFSDGTKVSVWSTHGDKTIRILAPPRLEEKKPIEIKECFCNYGFTAGLLIKPSDDQGYDVDTRPCPLTYDSQVCAKHSYLKKVVGQVTSSDHTGYEFGEGDGEQILILFMLTSPTDDVVQELPVAGDKTGCCPQFLPLDSTLDKNIIMCALPIQGSNIKDVITKTTTRCV